MDAKVQEGLQSRERPTLFLQLRAAIRVDHAVLNKAIFGRFPDCVPPKADDAYLYVAGMTVFGQIYYAIEDCWDRLLDASAESEDMVRYQEMLTRLRTPLLARSQKLRNDLAFIEKEILPASAAPFLDEMRNRGGVFNKRISDAIMENPAVLLAYAWVMYLALFNGGRWMAEELVAAGAKFWRQDGDAESYSEDVLSFWFFDDHSPKDNRQHGETVKEDFCRRFDHAAELVVEAEQDLVVEESRRLFRLCVEMVDFLNAQELQAHLDILRGRTPETNISGVAGYIVSWSKPVSSLWSAIAGQVRS